MSKLAELMGAARNVLSELEPDAVTHAQQAGRAVDPSLESTEKGCAGTMPPIHSYFASVEQPSLMAKLHSQEAQQAAELFEKEFEAKHEVEMLDSMVLVKTTLEAIHDDLARTTTVEFTAQSQRFLNHALEGVQQQCGISLTSASLESSPEEYLTASLEGVVAAIKSVWEAIVRAVNSIWAAITGFFKKLFGYKASTKQRLGALKDKPVRDSEELVKDLQKSMEHVLEVAQSSSSKRFQEVAEKFKKVANDRNKLVVKPSVAASLSKLGDQSKPLDTTHIVQGPTGNMVVLEQKDLKGLDLVYVGYASGSLQLHMESLGIRISQNPNGIGDSIGIRFEDWCKLMESLIVNDNQRRASQKACGALKGVFERFKGRLNEFDNPEQPLSQDDAVKLTNDVIGTAADDFLSSFQALVGGKGDQVSMVTGNGVFDFHVDTAALGLPSIKVKGRKDESPRNVAMYVDYPTPRQATDALNIGIALSIDQLLNSAPTEPMAAIKTIVGSITEKIDAMKNATATSMHYNVMAEFYQRPNRWMGEHLRNMGSWQRFVLAGQSRISEVAVTLTEQVRREIEAMSATA